MADYNKSTNFTAKDTLPTGNAGKIVKGTEIDTELNAVSNAIASKADINSPTFTGTPAAPTATLGTNTTQIATTAFVLAAMYPIGSVYINASSSSNPSILLGFGTWVAFGAGRVMVGLDASDALFDTAEETGGSKNATLVSHTHTASVADPGHIHWSSGGLVYGGAGSQPSQGVGATTCVGGPVTVLQVANTGITVNMTTEGTSATNANVQPFIVVRMWKRTA